MLKKLNGIKKLIQLKGSMLRKILLKDNSEYRKERD
ncbi:hypothetical protein BB14905_17930 [Bacillus sp. B14905]|nr:hypothetical protein BB14905_17930 [Bacillus sp. B14905]